MRTGKAFQPGLAFKRREAQGLSPCGNCGICWRKKMGYTNPMRKKLEEPIVEILHTRTHLSRNSNLFYLKELANEWRLHPITVRRYDEPRYRKYANTYAKKHQYKKHKGMCALCPNPLEGHPRCPDCTMLLHGKPECACAAINAFLAVA